MSPTATWGVPGAIVIVEGARTDAAEARVVLADCALSPRVAVGSSLLVESAADRPASVSLAKRAELSKLDSATAASSAGTGSTGPATAGSAAAGSAAAGSAATGSAAAGRVLRLPIAGHAIAVPLDAGGVYELATTDKDPETAWIAAPRPGAAVEVTDAEGQIVLRKLPPGPHAVTAWLPPRAGQPARIARGTVTVAAGGLAELSLPLAPVP